MHAVAEEGVAVPPPGDRRRAAPGRPPTGRSGLSEGEEPLLKGCGSPRGSADATEHKGFPRCPVWLARPSEL